MCPTLTSAFSRTQNNPRVDIPDEERMQEAIDRLPPTVTHEERIELKKIALE